MSVCILRSLLESPEIQLLTVEGEVEIIHRRIIPFVEVPPDTSLQLSGLELPGPSVPPKPKRGVSLSGSVRVKQDIRELHCIHLRTETGITSGVLTQGMRGYSSWQWLQSGSGYGM